MVSKTIKYYNDNGSAFVNDTREVKFDKLQSTFLNAVRKSTETEKPYILDFGCGSGRDTKYFVDNGCKVAAIDGSKEMVKAAETFAGVSVKCMDFREFNEIDKYDGIWACASILHLSNEEIVQVIGNLEKALIKKGVMYVSFKYGDFEGERSGRYFTDLTEITLEEIVKYNENLRISKIWITTDARPGRENEKWLNCLLIKS